MAGTGKYLQGYKNAVMFFLLAFITLIPIDIGYSNFAAALAFLSFFVFYPVVRKDLGSIDRRRFSALFSSVFVFYLLVLISLLYSSYTDDVMDFVDGRLTMALFPLMFFLGFTVTRRDFEVLLAGFVAGTMLKLLYFIGLALWGLSTGAIRHDQLVIDHVASLDHLFVNHRTYYSFYALLSLAAILSGKYLRYPVWFRVSAAVVILTSIFSYESRAVIALTLLSAAIYPFAVSRGRGLLTTAALTYGVVMFSLIVPISTGSYKATLDRINVTAEEFETGRIEATATMPEYDPRASRWNEALELIKERPFSGYGSGTEKPVLKAAYERSGLDWSAGLSLDVHNQYLSFALENGVLASLFYLYILILMFVYGLRRRDIFAMFFTLVIAFMSIFENLLNVNWVITLFAFVSTCYIFSFFTEPQHRGEK